jgi:hypothetical protein
VLTNIWTIFAVYGIEKQQQTNAARTATHHWEGIREWRHRLYEARPTMTAHILQQGQRFACFARSFAVTAGAKQPVLLRFLKFLTLKVGLLDAVKHDDLPTQALDKRKEHSKLNKLN